MVQVKPPSPARSGGKAGGPAKQSTLEDIMGSVGRSPNLRERQRRAMKSALRTVGRCLGKPLSEIPAQPAALQKELASANYLQAGISKRRWINTRSLTLSALRLSGAKIMPSRWQHSAFSPAWSALRAACSSQYHLIGLSRFMNHCSSLGIEPDAVDSETFTGFHHRIMEEALIRNPTRVFNATCRLWDSAHLHCPDWPLFKSHRATSVRGYSLDWSTFPASFTEDVEAFLTDRGDPSIFSDSPKAVRPATTLGRRSMLRQMATALVFSGFRLEELTGLDILVEPSNAEAILQFFLDRSDGTVRASLHNHACLLRTIARYWVKNTTYTKLDVFCRKIAKSLKKHRGMTSRNRTRLRQFDNPHNLAALLNLPTKLLKLARHEDIGGNGSVNTAMYAIAIEILISHPVRINNLVGLEIDRSVILPKDPKHPIVHLAIDGDDVKNGVPVERALSKSTSALILNYISKTRPHLTDVRSKWLFPSPAGKRRSVGGFGQQISTLIMRHTGVIVNVHLFRGLAVKLIEQESPGSLESARRLLGHRSIETTARAYSEGKASSAHKQYDEIVEAKRDQLCQINSRRARQQ